MDWNDEEVNGISSTSSSSKSALDMLNERLQKRELKPIDHSEFWRSFQFRKRFYLPSKKILEMDEELFQKKLKKLEITVRGKNCPRAIDTWEDAGMSERTLETLRSLGWKTPFPIQRQALPTILSGRDVIGIAKTGSGKTLAFLAPMIRHILDQPALRVEEREGPIAMIMAPARELAIQIHAEARKLCRPMGITTTCVYGGASVRDQIDDLKRGSQVVVCTPGRMIDLLCMNNGRLCSMRRVTFVVLDEADRMFDMGFEPQISMIMNATRPDRQTVLFSATFPHKVEALARKVLRAPIEIVVGGRSVASSDIDHRIEVMAGTSRFHRLLKLMGQFHSSGGILIFVDSQKRCDHVYTELTRMGYPCLSLHSGKDQLDRQHSIDDFKNHTRNVMIATSLAGRGLDVEGLVLVVNYTAPNHLEDYVHRVGRTGRAGNKGTAYTFVTPEEEQFSPDLVKALKDAGKEVPEELQSLADNFIKKVESGDARRPANQYKTVKGFKFDPSELSEDQRNSKLERLQFEMETGQLTDEERKAVEAERAALMGYEKHVQSFGTVGPVKCAL